MFVKYAFIPAEHRVALESCIRNHGIVNSHMLSDLYKLALANVDQQAVSYGFHSSHLKDGSISLGTATDSKTGFYIQLARIGSQKHLMLTVGAKWAMETTSSELGNTSTVLW